MKSLLPFIVATTLLSACSGAEKPSAPRVIEFEAAAPTCDSYGTGLSSPPSALTRETLAAVERAKTSSLESLVEGVARGDAVSQIELGLRYGNGTGVPVDAERAVVLFAAAASQDNPIAKYLLGTAYANGQGAPLDPGRAAALWTEAAQQGHSLSQFWLGMFIAQGRGGISASWCGASPLFMAAAKEKEGDAAYMLGYGHQTGELSNFDYQKAAEWYRKANSFGLNQKAQFNLRVLIEERKVKWQEGDPGVAPQD